MKLLGTFSRALAAAALTLLIGCPGAGGGLGVARTPEGDRWYQRASQAFAISDVEEARESVNRALATSGDDAETRLLGAKIALARLDYAETIRLLKPVKCDEPSDARCKKMGTEAAGLRGRALWYKGDLDAAADELEAVLNDPEVKDDWAKSVASLARHAQGRTPFALSGALLASTEMIQLGPDNPYFLVEVEIDGERALALVHTANAEVVIDSSTRQEPSWVQMRFGNRLEVKDVPAVPQDLSGLTKELGAPVKALLGVNLLRHLNATVDYEGHQFVARTFTPPQPPDATRVPLYYFKGGGMIVRSGFGGDKGPTAALLLNTGVPYAIALDQAGWKKAGIDVANMKTVPQAPDLKEGLISMLRLGAFDVPQVPGLYGAQMNRDIENMEKSLSPVDIDGVLGAGLLSHYRCTLGDGGRILWVEDASALAKVLNQGQPVTQKRPAPLPPVPNSSPKNSSEAPKK